MKKNLFILALLGLLSSCSFVQDLVFTESIAGVKIMSVEDIENKDGIFVREIRGTLDSPVETDEEWFLAFQAIYSQKKVAGMDVTIKIFTDQDNWEIGTPHAVGKFSEKQQTRIKVEGRLIKYK